MWFSYCRSEQKQYFNSNNVGRPASEYYIGINTNCWNACFCCNCVFIVLFEKSKKKHTRASPMISKQWWFPITFWFMSWSGRFGVSRLIVLVIFRVGQRGLGLWSGSVLWTSKIHCWGKGVNKERRKGVIAQDLTRPLANSQTNILIMCTVSLLK